MSEWRPKVCSCGGTIHYVDDGQRVWSFCDWCTPCQLPTDEDDNRCTPHATAEEKKQ